MGKFDWFLSDMNRNIPTTWRWASGVLLFEQIHYNGNVVREAKTFQDRRLSEKGVTILMNEEGNGLLFAVVDFQRKFASIGLDFLT